MQIKTQNAFCFCKYTKSIVNNTLNRIFKSFQEISCKTGRRESIHDYIFTEENRLIFWFLLEADIF